MVYTVYSFVVAQKLHIIYNGSACDYCSTAKLIWNGISFTPANSAHQ
jgi:hypothetical protein